MNVISKNNSLGLFIGESFAELVLVQDGKAVGLPTRWYLPRQSLKNFLQKWLKDQNIQSLNSVFIAQRHLERIFHFRLGGSVAQVFNLGDQHFLNFQQKQNHGSYFQLNKAPDLSSAEMGFVFDSKTNVTELVEKLKTAGSKRVCLQQNSNHPSSFEKLIPALKEAAFELYLSDDLHRGSSLVEDHERWQENLLNASLAGSYKELKEDVYSAFEGVVSSEKIFLLNADLSWHNFENSKVCSSLLAMENLFLKDFEDLRKERISFVHFGLENFSLIQGPAKPWQNPWGSVALATASRVALRLQPTQMITLNKYNEIDADSKELSFEPGPLSLGRGHTLCVFDLLSHAKKQPEAWQSADCENKILKGLIALSRNSKNKIDEASVVKKVTEHFLSQILNEVSLRSENSSIVLYGYFAELLKRFDLNSDRFHFVSENERPKSYLIANWGLKNHA